MKARTPLIALLALTLIAPQAVQAQEAERGQLYEVAIWKVSPDNIDEFMEAVGMMRAAAVAANLGPEWGWQIWLRDFEVGVVSTVENMAAFDDEGAWMRAYAGTPGEEMLNAAMEKFEAEVTATPASREVWELEEAWSYVPGEAGVEVVGFAEMFEFWIKPGMEAAFEELAGEMGGFLTELDGPYPVNGFRTLMGDVAKITFVAQHDGWSDYYGPESLEAGLAESGMGGEWEVLMERLRDCVTESRTSQMTLFADGSYAGPGM
jgi:hypothetical protein